MTTVFHSHAAQESCVWPGRMSFPAPPNKKAPLPLFGSGAFLLSARLEACQRKTTETMRRLGIRLLSNYPSPPPTDQKPLLQMQQFF